MTHLNIQQGSNVEIVTTLIIKKLYEAALSVPEPLEGELDTAYMSGNLLVNRAYRSLIEYLTNRFDDLHINVTDSYYIPIEDSAVLNVLLANNIGSDGIGVTEVEAANATLTSAMFSYNTDITSFDEFKYFTKANTNPPIDLFRGCTNLTNVDFINTTKFVRNEFSHSGVTTINAPNLETISGWGCFTNSGLVEIQNLGNISSIDGGFAQECVNLRTVNLPTSCTTIMSKAFRSCTNLETINLLFVTSYPLDGAFLNCGTLHVSTSELQNVTTIGVDTFHNAPVYGNLYLPKLISLESNAFYNSCANVPKITCLGKISSIRHGTFDCQSLSTSYSEVILPYECVSIGIDAFRNARLLSSIKQYTLSIDDWIEGETPTYTDISRVTAFGDCCFQNCSSLQIPTSALVNATTIGNNAFNGCTLLTGVLNLPNLTGIVGRDAFRNTHISSISNLGSVTEIGMTAFGDTDISSITIPNSVRKCACNIVHNTVVPEIIFPEGVEEIYDGLFWTKNDSLTYIEIPSTVTKMGVFFHRSLENSQNNLCTLIIKAITPPEVNYYNNITSTIRGDKFAGIYVPDSSLTAYQNGANAWLHSSIQAKLKPISQLLTDNPTAWAKYNRTSTV